MERAARYRPLARRNRDGRAAVQGAGATSRCAADFGHAVGGSAIAYQQYELASDATLHPDRPPFPILHPAWTAGALATSPNPDEKLDLRCPEVTYIEDQLGACGM